MTTPSAQPVNSTRKPKLLPEATPQECRCSQPQTTLSSPLCSSQNINRKLSSSQGSKSQARKLLLSSRAFQLRGSGRLSKIEETTQSLDLEGLSRQQTTMATAASILENSRSAFVILDLFWMSLMCKDSLNPSTQIKEEPQSSTNSCELLWER